MRQLKFAAYTALAICYLPFIWMAAVMVGVRDKIERGRIRRAGTHHTHR